MFLENVLWNHTRGAGLRESGFTFFAIDCSVMSHVAQGHGSQAPATTKIDHDVKMLAVAIRYSTGCPLDESCVQVHKTADDAARWRVRSYDLKTIHAIDLWNAETKEWVPTDWDQCVFHRGDVMAAAIQDEHVLMLWNGFESTKKTIVNAVNAAISSSTSAASASVF
jgi:hypothetical protein